MSRSFFLGVGKSFVGRTSNEAFLSRLETALNCCPTGAGATQMTKGRTFHSAFSKGSKGKLGEVKIRELRETFGNLGLVVVDEVSMLSAEDLFLMDQRLRQVFNPYMPFGGISILLLGDTVS
jgi:hypothetical protein